MWLSCDIRELSSPSSRDRATLNLSKSGLTVLTEEYVLARVHVIHVIIILFHYRHLGDSTSLYSTLNVSFNKLKSLPVAIGTLTRLTVLEIG